MRSSNTAASLEVQCLLRLRLQAQHRRGWGIEMACTNVPGKQLKPFNRIGRNDERLQQSWKWKLRKRRLSERACLRWPVREEVPRLSCSCQTFCHQLALGQVVRCRCLWHLHPGKHR